MRPALVTRRFFKIGPSDLLSGAYKIEYEKRSDLPFSNAVRNGEPQFCYAEYIPAAKMWLSQIGLRGAGTLLLMKALVISRSRGPEVLEVPNVPDPVPISG